MFCLQGDEDPSQRRRAVGDVDPAASKHRGGRSNGTPAREPEAGGGGDTTGTVRAASRDGGRDLFLCDAIGAFIFISSRIGNCTDVVFLCVTERVRNRADAERGRRAAVRGLSRRVRHAGVSGDDCNWHILL